MATVIGRPITGAIVESESQHGAAPQAPLQIDLGGKNWIGMLIEYRHIHPSFSGPIYHESSPGLSVFTCSVAIGECPDPIGGNVNFNKKKDAKQYASKLAIEWLAENKRMSRDRTISFPNPSPVPQSLNSPNPDSLSTPQPFRQSFNSPDPSSSSSQALGSGPVPVEAPATSYGQAAAALCTKLGFPPAVYMITPHPQFAAMYSGYAHFDGHPLAPGKIGEFKDVYGKKKAREKCAEGLLAFMQGIEQHRSQLLNQPAEAVGGNSVGMEATMNHLSVLEDSEGDSVGVDLDTMMAQEIRAALARSSS